MNMSKCRKALPIAFLLLAGGLGLPADAERETSVEHLLPLESRSMSVERDSSLMRSAAEDINRVEERTSDSSDIVDAMGLDFLEGLVDENGDIALPLGLTVFEAMGTTSVGFGDDF